MSLNALLLIGLCCVPVLSSAAPWQAERRKDGRIVLVTEAGDLLLDAGIRFSLNGTEQELSHATEDRTREVSGPLGKGTERTFGYENEAYVGMRTVTLYDGFATVRTRIEARKGRISANRIEVFRARYPDFWNRNAQLLRVPFDNDKWVRYRAFPADTTFSSSEVGCLYDNTTRFGLVAGSLTHDLWKSAIHYDAPNCTLTAISGETSKWTRDLLPHGVVSGDRIESALFVVMIGDDWRSCMERFGAQNAVVSGRREWPYAKPVGWNSWGSMKFDLTIEKLDQTSAFIAEELMPAGLTSADGTFWFCFDSGWQRFSDEDLDAFIRRCHARGQKVGAYLAPYGHWGKRHDQRIDKRYNATFEDAALKAGGRVQTTIANAVALDPTHPAVQARIDGQIARIRRLGFDFVKIDFLTQASLEADSRYDKRITTGMAAYNYALRYLCSRLGDKIFINQAISPLFPAQYAHSRRIACDAWSRIGQSEYTLNALTYGWWLNRAYCYNDPDHLVLRDAQPGANRVRITSGLLTGLALLGDDWSEEAVPDMRPRAKSLLTVSAIDSLLSSGIRFRPVEAIGKRASNLFVGYDRNVCYVALLNYDDHPLSIRFDPQRWGLPPGKRFQCLELWSGTERILVAGDEIVIPASDAFVCRMGQIPLN